MDDVRAAGGVDHRPVICVFCGASRGKDPLHAESARALAEQIHKHNMRLVYGGGTTGLMGEVARTLVSLSGPSAVHGIIPKPLLAENGDSGIDESVYGKTTVVDDMHTRKSRMAKEVIDGGPGGGFVVLSGGFGTIEEMMEMTTWNQLGIHRMPIVLLNVQGYWDGILDWTRKATDEEFIRGGNSGMFVEASSAEGVFDSLKNYVKPESQFQLSWDSI